MKSKSSVKPLSWSYFLPEHINKLLEFFYSSETGCFSIELRQTKN
jgi:hypothetical protein